MSLLRRPLHTAFRRPHSLLHASPRLLPSIHHATTTLNTSSPSRSFSSTRPRAFLPETTEFLTNVHDTTGLPWAAIIPLTALTIRTTITLPLTIISTTNIRKLLTLRPVINAATHSYRSTVSLRPSSTPAPITEKSLAEIAKSNAREILARHNVHLWFNYLPLLQLPVWFGASFTIRNLVAKKDGLLAYFWGDSVASAPAVGMTQEGLGWCTDLTMADPTGVLSAAMATGLMANVGLAMYTNQGVAGKWAKRFQRAFMLVAVASFPLTLNMPAALVLYWSTSAWFSVIQNAGLDYFLPRKKESIKPCTSPDREGLVNRIQMKDLREKGDNWGGYWGQREVLGLQRKEPVTKAA